MPLSRERQRLARRQAEHMAQTFRDIITAMGGRVLGRPANRKSVDGRVAIEKGPNIASLPTFAPLPDTIEGPVLLKVGDDVSTDEIKPAGMAGAAGSAGSGDTPGMSGSLVLSGE